MRNSNRIASATTVASRAIRRVLVRPGFLGLSQYPLRRRRLDATEQEVGNHSVGQRIFDRDRQCDPVKGQGVRMGGQPVRDRAVPNQSVGTDAGQAASGSTGGDRDHAFPAARSGAIHDPVFATADAEFDLHAIRPVAAGLPRYRRCSDQWRGLFHGYRVPARRFFQDYRESYRKNSVRRRLI